jgi:hypothetical protein
MFMSDTVVPDGNNRLVALWYQSGFPNHTQVQSRLFITGESKSKGSFKRRLKNQLLFFLSRTVQLKGASYRRLVVPRRIFSNRKLFNHSFGRCFKSLFHQEIARGDLLFFFPVEFAVHPTSGSNE